MSVATHLSERGNEQGAMTCWKYARKWARGLTQEKTNLLWLGCCSSGLRGSLPASRVG